MSKTINETYRSAKHTMNAANQGAEHVVEAAKHAVDAARVGASDAVSSVRSTFWDGLKTVTSLIAVLRSLEADDALKWAGLARRRSPLVSLGTFSAGFLLGAGAGVLFAPTSGVELRRKMMSTFSGTKAAATAEPATTTAQKASDASGRSPETNGQAAFRPD